jgi:hypothetical protein
MLQLEPTTLFYHDLTFRLIDKSSAGLIDNWAAKIPSAQGNSVRSARSKTGSRLGGSTTVGSSNDKVSSERRKPVATSLTKPQNPPGSRSYNKDVFNINTSDEEYLASSTRTQIKKERKDSVSAFHIHYNGGDYRII